MRQNQTNPEWSHLIVIITFSFLLSNTKKNLPSLLPSNSLRILKINYTNNEKKVYKPLLNTN